MLTGFVPEDERIVLIESRPEIQISQKNVLRFDANQIQNGQRPVTTRDLLESAMGRRPDRIVVGELRVIARVRAHYDVSARRALFPCSRLLRFKSATNRVQRQFLFLHFPKQWWEASGSSQLSHGVARCAFRFWLRACFFSCSAICASPFGSRVTGPPIVCHLTLLPPTKKVEPSDQCGSLGICSF